ncbi:MAG: hypothetical protein ACK5MI_06250 [Mangrovibacterium sp.]
MFFVGLISTQIPYLLLVGMILVALFQPNNEIDTAAENEPLHLISQQVPSQKYLSGSIAEDTYYYHDLKFEFANYLQPDLNVPIIEVKQKYNTSSFNSYQSIICITSSGLSPPIFI